MFNFEFFSRSVLLGVSLAMDAFSVSLANGLNEPCMKKGRMSKIAGIFSFFQFAMPMLGWVCVFGLAKMFGAFEKYIPWIALFLLCFIGGKMIFEGIKNKECDEEKVSVSFSALILQGVATSIDALSVGFTISEYDLVKAFAACVIIAIVTFFICMGGLAIGKKFGTKLSGFAGILGGVILIAIGIEIFLKGILA